MTKTLQQLQITIFKVVVFVVCRVAELHPFVRCICLLSGSGISGLGHLHWNTCCTDTCNIFFPETGQDLERWLVKESTKQSHTAGMLQSAAAWNTVVLTDAVWQDETAHYCGSISEGTCQSCVLKSSALAHILCSIKNVLKGSQSF